MVKAKKVIYWIIVNIGILALFVFGNLGVIASGFLSIAVFMYWTISIIGLFYFSKIVTENFYKDNKNWTRTFNSKFDGIFDVIVVLIMVYFGYIILPIIYLFSYFGLNEFEKNYINIKNIDDSMQSDSTEKVDTNHPWEDKKW